MGSPARASDEQAGGGAQRSRVPAPINERLDPWVTGGLRAKLRGGREIEISRRQAVKFQKRMRL